MLLGHWSSTVFSELGLILGAEDPVHLMGNLEDLGSGMFLPTSWYLFSA